MGVHLCGRCLQPRQNAESGLHASSFRISLGRSVSKRQKTGVWITEFPQNRSKLKPNSPAQAIGKGNSSRQPPFPHPVRNSAMVRRNEASPKRISFDKHSVLIERTQRSAKAF